MTQPDLARLAGLVERATKGPWVVYSESEVGLPPSLFAGRVMLEGFGPIEPLTGYDLELVVAMHEALPALLARIAALEGCVRTIAEHKPISPALAHIVQMQRIARAALTLKENDDG